MHKGQLQDNPQPSGVPEGVGEIFSALSDPIRLSIVHRLAENGEMAVGALSEPYSITAPAISRHLRVLESVGIVERRIDRQWRICSLNAKALSSAKDWLNAIAA